MNNKLVVAGLVVLALLIGALLFFKSTPIVAPAGSPSGPAHYSQEPFLQGLTAGVRGQLVVDNLGNITLSNGSTGTIYNAGFIVAGQGHVSSASGYGTTTAGSATVPVSTFCLAQTWLDPVGTAAITLTLPAASSTFTGCSGATAGAWSPQMIDNQSSNAITLATTTGGANINFMYATGTAQALISYPPKIQASTTAEIREMFIDSTHLDFMITEYQKPANY